ncbi:MAG: HNH endonuclease [Candidatus Pacebacteria bacterium]|jgi:hypothetical protein|nr:HNH endonuclease [Candidatus Paceibacterota bacterium]
MKWSLIQKTANPTIESYGCRDSRVKEFLREEGGFRCVYCAVHENALGGIQAFHVEHYRPKSKPEFAHLENSLSNLFYACPICNRFKANDWPGEPKKKHSVSSYPDPSTVDYSTLFKVSESTGLVSGPYVASKYMIERLYFNRPQLILERKEYFLRQAFEKLNADHAVLIGELVTKGGKTSGKLIKKLTDLNTKVTKHLMDLKKIPAYELADVRRRRS